MAVDSKAFRDVMSRLASGVTVVTTICDGAPHGLTVSAFSSVSLSPPRVLVCLGNDTDSKPLVERSGRFAVHILGREHAAFGTRFAKLIPAVEDDLFAGVSYRTEQTGCPILNDCLAWLDCTVFTTLAVGDHTIFVGSVEAAGAAEAGEPVLYYRRAWRVLGPDALDV
jgi:flavin reductase (DIM6/NTAB) family NADH-FMN oxidoreductase RutF